VRAHRDAERDSADSHGALVCVTVSGDPQPRGAASGSAARLGEWLTVRRGAGAPGTWPARRRGEAGARPNLFHLGNFERSFLPKFELQCLER
jgi:hypothetical protein